MNNKEKYFLTKVAEEVSLETIRDKIEAMFPKRPYNELAAGTPEGMIGSGGETIPWDQFNQQTNPLEVLQGMDPETQLATIQKAKEMEEAAKTMTPVQPDPTNMTPGQFAWQAASRAGEGVLPALGEEHTIPGGLRPGQYMNSPTDEGSPQLANLNEGEDDLPLDDEKLELDPPDPEGKPDEKSPWWKWPAIAGAGGLAAYGASHLMDDEKDEKKKKKKKKKD